MVCCPRGTVVSADPRPGDIADQIEQVNEATRRLLAGLDSLTEADAGRPSLCPGWTVGHVLTHIARNGDGLRRGAEGARRGEAVPMYDSAEARDHEIDAGAGRPMTELVADVTSSAAGLSEVWSAMSTADWDRATAPSLRHAAPERHTDDAAVRVGDPSRRSRGPVPARWVAGFARGPHSLQRGPAARPAARRRGTAGARHRQRRALECGCRGGAGAAGAGARRVAVAGPSWAIAAWLVGLRGPVADVLTVTGGELPLLKPWP